MYHMCHKCGIIPPIFQTTGSKTEVAPCKGSPAPAGGPEGHHPGLGRKQCALLLFESWGDGENTDKRRGKHF